MFQNLPKPTCFDLDFEQNNCQNSKIDQLNPIEINEQGPGFEISMRSLTPKKQWTIQWRQAHTTLTGPSYIAQLSIQSHNLNLRPPRIIFGLSRRDWNY